MSRRGQSLGTVATLPVAAQAATASRREPQSPRFGRLLPLGAAAQYLGVSRWMIQQYVQAGQIPVTRLPRPRTASATRGVRPSGECCRLVLVDVRDLDGFVDQHCTKETRQ